MPAPKSSTVGSAVATTATTAAARVASPAASPASSPSPTATASGETSGTASNDVVLLGPPTDDGGGVHVLRAREDRIEAGELRALAEGKPITGEVVSLRPRQDNPRICDVTSSFSPSGAPAKRKGPAQVATDAYREGWDGIFGNGSKSPSSLN